MEFEWNVRKIILMGKSIGHYVDSPVLDEFVYQCDCDKSTVVSNCLRSITKTYLYNSDPLKPNFYIVKLRLTGILFFLFLLKIIDYGYSFEPPRKAVLTSTHNLCFEQKYENYQNFYLKLTVFWW